MKQHCTVVTVVFPLHEVLLVKDDHLGQEEEEEEEGQGEQQHGDVETLHHTDLMRTRREREREPREPGGLVNCIHACLCQWIVNIWRCR